MFQFIWQCLDIASCTRNDDNDEVRRYRRNWIVIHTTTFLMSLTYTIVLSSQHQFITNPRDPEDPNELPGLEETEVFYSLTIAIFSVGELIALLVFSALSSWHIKLKHLLLFGLFLLVTGGLFYGVAQYGWMVLVGRFLQGLHLGAHSTLLRIYIGETSNTVRDILQEDYETSQLKNTNFLLSFIMGTIGLAMGPGLAAVITQIPLVDVFRWSGWYLAFHGMIQMLVVLVIFKENWSDLKRTSVNCKRSSLLSGIAVPFYCIIFVIVAFFVINCTFSIVETLQNPILGDNFGMDVKWSSYIFVITLLFFPPAIGVIFVMQRKGLHNRYIFLCGITASIVACFLITDWQAISKDPCDQFSGTCRDNETSLEFDNDTSPLPSCELCRMHSGDPYHCFFNPDARISNEYCADCRPFCRSKLHTLNFAQFLIGVCLFGLSFPLMRIPLTIILSDSMGSASQSLMMGLFICSGALARATAPLWGDAAYVAANHHTYFPLLMLAGMLFAILVMFALLFRRLTPYHGVRQKHHSDANGDFIKLANHDNLEQETTLAATAEITSL